MLLSAVRGARDDEGVIEALAHLDRRSASPGSRVCELLVGAGSVGAGLLSRALAPSEMNVRVLSGRSDHSHVHLGRVGDRAMPPSR